MAKIDDMTIRFQTDSLKNYEKLMIIIQKFYLDHILHDVYTNSNETSLFFQKKDECNTSNATFYLRYENGGYCAVTVSYNYGIYIDYKTSTIIDTKLIENYSPFLNHFSSCENFQINMSGYVNINKGISNNIINITNFINNIKFFENSFYDILPLFKGINKYDAPTNKRNQILNLTQFGKLKHISESFKNLSLPSKQSINSIIDSLKFLKEPECRYGTHLKRHAYTSNLPCFL